jgi:hypothetical protein
MLLSAMQLIKTTLTSLPVIVDSSRIIVLTKAVLPVPGDPEINRLAAFWPSSMDGPSKKVVRKPRMEARSAARPAISMLELLQVDRRRARARAWRGSKDVGGVGGGVEITSLEISVVGVAGGRDATDAFRRRAKGEDKNIEKRNFHL